MFRDRSEELRRLEEALLEEEEPIEETQAEEDADLLAEDLLDEWLEDTSPAKDTVVYQNYSNDYGSEKEEDVFEDYPPEKKKDNFGLVIIVCLLLMVGLCAAGILLLRRGGFL